MTSERPTPRVFRYPPSTRRFAIFMSVVSIGIVTYVILMYQGYFLEKLFIFLLFAALAVSFSLLAFVTQITIDDAGITERTPLSTKALSWGEIEDVLDSGRLLLLTARGGLKRIFLFRGEHGFSLEPFGELRQEILRRVCLPLSERWRQRSLAGARVYPHPSLSAGQTLAYLLPLLLVGVFFVAAPLREGVFGVEQLLFLALAVFAIAIFFVRDYRRSKRKLVLREDGILETNGGSTLLLWNDIERVIIRDPVMFGYGSVVVLGRTGGKIRVPRRIRSCGELLFLLLNRSRPTIVEGFEY